MAICTGVFLCWKISNPQRHLWAAFRQGCTNIGIHFHYSSAVSSTQLSGDGCRHFGKGQTAFHTAQVQQCHSPAVRPARAGEPQCGLGNRIGQVLGLRAGVDPQIELQARPCLAGYSTYPRPQRHNTNSRQTCFLVRKAWGGLTQEAAAGNMSCLTSSGM